MKNLLTCVFLSAFFTGISSIHAEECLSLKISKKGKPTLSLFKPLADGSCPKNTLLIGSNAAVAGPQGIAGPQGPAGLTGASGPQGPIGLNGATGPQGPAGPQGASGPQGTSGSTDVIGYAKFSTGTTPAVVSYGGSKTTSVEITRVTTGHFDVTFTGNYPAEILATEVPITISNSNNSAKYTSSFVTSVDTVLKKIVVKIFSRDTAGALSDGSFSVMVLAPQS